MTLSREQSNALKVIAVLLMIIDHVGAVFFPEEPIWRMVGRLAFPLFAYQLAIGFQYTSNRKKQFVYLGVFALISQIPYMLALHITPDDFSFNVFFTFLLSYGLMMIWERLKLSTGLLVGFLTLLLTLVWITDVPVDYGWYGVLMPFLFYLLRDKPLLQIVILFGLTGWKAYYGSPLQVFAIFASVLPVMLSIVSIPPFKLSKWFFYWFYPVHLGILALLISMMTT